jgi:excinuclease ABC subunit A
MSSSDIVVKGAREHNLRDVNLVLPRNQLICLTGVSGSGKSSFAFDTLFAEGQRRYVESLSSFARQFLGQMPKPDVDYISGLSPSISISQKSSGSNPRSTVGTITEIYDFLRVLYARVGQGCCPQCGQEISAQTRDQILGALLTMAAGTDYLILAPLIREQKGEHRDLFVDLRKRGFIRVRVDGEIYNLDSEINLDRTRRHNIEVVIDRLQVNQQNRGRIAEAVETALRLGKGTMIVTFEGDGDSAGSLAIPAELSANDLSLEFEQEQSGGRKKTKRGSQAISRARQVQQATRSDRIFSTAYACLACGISFIPPTPQMFSFNSPQGMCLACDGLGTLFTFDPEKLVTRPGKSIQQGCIELLGSWKDLGRWRRHIYQGVADAVERKLKLEPGTMLETAWEELSPKLQNYWLQGTGDWLITYTWRGGVSPMKYGGSFAGLIAELQEGYRNAKAASKIRKLEEYMAMIQCPSCQGARLNDQSRNFRCRTAHPDFQGRNSLTLPEVCGLSIADAFHFFSGLELDKTRQFIATEPLKEIRNRLGFLLNVGLDYLMLNRTAPTLSGGESQRIRLAGQIGAGLVGVLYILDEPSIGLHPRDNDRLISTLHRLRDLGNTVIVVEHDEDTMRASDYLIDFGPGPGVRGGEVVVQGPPAKIMGSKASVTAQYLSGRKRIEIPPVRRAANPAKQLKLIGARHNNLKNIDVEIPLGLFVCVTGVSGSGKSSFVNAILREELKQRLNGGISEAGPFEDLLGCEHLDKMIAIDQSPIGRTPRSNPGTYIKLFDEIRDLYTQLPEAKARGYAAGRFSFNVKGGRCEACEGNGSNRLEMDFLADVWVTCPVCEGHRFNRETLQVKFREKSIADVLEMDVQEALGFFENIPKVVNKLNTLHSVGLDYLQIGQPSPTLSGGEAQRIKLAKELSKRSTGKTIYMLDEPTTGLHFADIHLLLNVLQDFVDAGNTVLVVEHNLDVIKTADWVIDIGPEGGSGGGRVVVAGTPEQVAACEESYTGRALRRLLEREDQPTNGKETGRGSRSKSQRGNRKSAGAPEERDVPVSSPVFATEITVRGAEQHNLKTVDLSIPRDKMTVFSGPSGSGKSSLAMDTIYAEGQRRYVESLSTYARQFVNQLEKPKVEHIEGLSPAIAIEQKTLGSSPRSTVGTVTEIYDYLRVLLARLGTPTCPACDQPVSTQTSDQVVDKIMAAPEGTRLLLTAPIKVEPNQDFDLLWEGIRKNGFVRVRVDGVTHGVDSPPVLNPRGRHQIEIVVDRIVVQTQSRSRIADSVEAALAIGEGVLLAVQPQEGVAEQHWDVFKHSQHLACGCCGRGFDLLTPNHFSFNSPLGWCPDCEGLGLQTGASPALLIQDPELSLRKGAISLWPDLNSTVSQAMLQAISAGTGIPLDTPFNQLEAKKRKLILYGTGDRWFDVNDAESGHKFGFQFKGIFQTLDEASRLSAAIRSRIQNHFGEVECGSCGGSRLRDDAAAVVFKDLTMDGLCRLPVGLLLDTVRKWKLNPREKKIAGEIIREITNRLEFLDDVGLEYLTLDRTAGSLSNGEAQRIRLASQLGSGLCGVLYVLDEPTIGLHPRDNTRLLKALHRLRDLGNTLIVVEHDKEVIANSDMICDFGPQAGAGGGRVVAQGAPDKLGRQPDSVTGPYLNGKKAIPIPANRRPALSPGLMPEFLTAGGKGGNKKSRGKGNAATATSPRKKTTARNSTDKSADQSPDPANKTTTKPFTPLCQTLEIVGAKHNNLKDLTVKIPLQTLTVVTGPSGCGKSSLVNDVLHRALARRLHRSSANPGNHRGIRGIEHINKVIQVDQSSLGNSPSSNPATYTGVFDLIRELFAQLPDSKIRGYSSRIFSFNVPGGRCEACQGNGQNCIEMHFLPDVWVECADCKGARYNEETLAVRYNGKSISDVLRMSCREGVELFHNIPKIRRILQTLCDVGLDYLQLGQSAATLSGGEAQRVKLAAELARPATGRTLYLLDEPTTGLHFDDIRKLLDVLHRLVDVGNTVVLIEHNLDMIKAADWVLDMGPEAGQSGGQIVVAGTPEEVADYARKALESSADKTSKSSKLASGNPPRSYTGEALLPVLQSDPYEQRTLFDPAREDRWKQGDMDIEDVGASVPMPWEVDGRFWHTEGRISKTGEEIQWDGGILAEVVDRIQAHDGFAETNWNDRTTVEIIGSQKSRHWFFHALTGDPWFLKLKFRVPPRTFKRETLEADIPLATANQLEDIPLFGNAPRMKLTNGVGGAQEIEWKLHSFAEIDRPEFWAFLEEAIESFLGRNSQKPLKMQEETPWAKLGAKWHLMTKGFSTGEIVWKPSLLEKLRNLLTSIAPEGEFNWNNQTVVHLNLPGRKDPWITLQTKKPDGLWLQISGPPGSLTAGQVVDFATEVQHSSSGGKETLRICFRQARQIEHPQLKVFLKEQRDRWL